ncbi:MAG: DNA gyrase subunit A [Bacteroidetes bacterium]|nr:DNA gyrase subunit A [Bacteroidota bacterium]
MADNENIIPINIEEEMKSAYIDYSMSVIVSRALPDVRDGLKPVHRRVLYAMQDLGVTAGKPHKKSARIVGEVLGKYHPHGDGSVYDAMVRMAQSWSLRYPLVDPQGNFGSIDGDGPAAMRYTEARLRRIAEEMLSDIGKDTVDFGLNFDDSLEEPTVLPARIPNLLINGASGIAVGMATNILPHNLREVANGIIAYVDNRDITIPELMEYIKAPDFPTGGIIYGYDGVKEALETGRGKIVVRARTEVETSAGGRESIIVSEIPYQVNKGAMLEKIGQLVNDKKLEGISAIRDESGRREAMRIVFELKRDAVATVVLNQLYKYTQLQTSYGVNNIALVDGRPRMLNIKQMIGYFVEFRHEVIVRRSKYELAEAEKRAHILEGLIIALDNLDAVIELIRASRTPDEAREGLMQNFGLSEIQAKAILEMRLQRLTGLEMDKIRQEYAEIMETIARLKAILADEGLRMQIIKDETAEIRDKYGDERRTTIDYSGGDFRMEDIIPKEDVVITISHLGYIKRTAATEYRAQARGGKGAKGGSTRDEDFIEHIFVASSHDYMLFFTELGRCFWLKVYEIPEGTRTSKGRAIQNLVAIPREDRVRAYINIPDFTDEDFINSHYLVFCTRKGVIKKTLVEQFSRPRTNGIIAVNVRDGDTLLEACLTNGSCHIVMALRSGKAVRFHEDAVREMGRNASGVRGITLANDEDEVVGMVCVDKSDTDEVDVLVLSEKGYGKRTPILDYPETNRGGKGVKTMQVTEKTGKLVGLAAVTKEQDLMIITESGIAIRIAVKAISQLGRATQGVRVIRLGEEEHIASIARLEPEDESETSTEEDTVLDQVSPLAGLENDEIPETFEDDPEEDDVIVDELDGEENEDGEPDTQDDQER